MSWQVTPSPLQLWVPVSISAGVAGRDHGRAAACHRQHAQRQRDLHPPRVCLAGMRPSTAATGLISGTIAQSAVSSSPDQVVVTATDGNVSISTSFTWSVAELALACSEQPQQPGRPERCGTPGRSGQRGDADVQRGEPACRAEHQQQHGAGQPGTIASGRREQQPLQCDLRCRQ